MAAPAATGARQLLIEGDQLLAALEEPNLTGRRRLPAELSTEVTRDAARIRPGRGEINLRCPVRAHGLVLAGRTME